MRLPGKVIAAFVLALVAFVGVQLFFNSSPAGLNLVITSQTKENTSIPKPLPESAGDVSGIKQGEIVVSENTPNEPLPAETLPDKPVPAETLPDKPLSAETLPDKPLPAENLPNQPLPAETLPDKPLPAETLPDKPVPAETLPDKPLPAETQNVAQDSLPINNQQHSAPDTEKYPQPFNFKNVLKFTPENMEKFVTVAKLYELFDGPSSYINSSLPQHDYRHLKNVCIHKKKMFWIGDNPTSVFAADNTHTDFPTARYELNRVQKGGVLEDIEADGRTKFRYHSNPTFLQTDIWHKIIFHNIAEYIFWLSNMLRNQAKVLEPFGNNYKKLDRIFVDFPDAILNSDYGIENFDRMWSRWVAWALIYEHVPDAFITPSRGDVIDCFSQAFLLASVGNTWGYKLDAYGLDTRRKNIQSIREAVFHAAGIKIQPRLPIKFESPETAPALKVFVYSRRNTERRILLNSEEVTKAIRQKFPTFEVTLLHDMPTLFIDQVRLFSETDIIVAPPGSHLANELWMQPNSIVIELAFLKEIHTWSLKLGMTDSLDIQFEYAFGGEPTGEKEHANLTSDPALTVEAITKLLSNPDYRFCDDPDRQRGDCMHYIIPYPDLFN
eukprot:NODE_191_length_1946_cov_94.472787_g167_i0.p1 GENE.NODE_191_length_1946_cov_94.472787_g167_i0~~NODE_191_length_1946_cov_94.472787_g167_i0.p1  ORF type:complete len:610 (+),score=87.95 NODE_191_length_1946_cov_94.472787_g167_i0:108-1937(+)